MTLTGSDAETSARLTFAQFESYSHAYLAHRDRLLASRPSSAAQTLSWLTYATGWRYDAPLYTGKAFEATAGLSRSFDVLHPTPQPTSGDDEQDEQMHHNHPLVDDDQAETSTRGPETVTIHQSITFSPIWSLPVLHFHATTHSGQPLPLELLSRLHVVHPDAESIAAISVGDHPRTALPSYYLHPCNTNQALGALLQQEDQSQDKDIHKGWRYMSTFVSLCASALEMRAS